MNKREKIIGVVMMSVILVWGLMNLPKKDDPSEPASSKKSPVRANRTPAKPAKKPTDHQAQPVSDEELPEEPAYDLEDLTFRLEMRHYAIQVAEIKDPFKEIEVEKAPLSFSGLVLHGLRWEEEAPIALINDYVLKEGDTFAGFTVKEIRKEEVVLTKGMERYILKFTADGKVD